LLIRGTDTAMETLATDSAIPPNRRKPKIWDRMRRRNSSSPSFQRLETQNWSSRSLPRFGSFGSASVIDGNTVTPKSSPIWTPVVDEVSILDEVLRTEPEVDKDHFSGLPSEIKLHIFSLLPVKTLARASAVINSALQSNRRYANSGNHCVMMAPCTGPSILGRSTGISPLQS
jgi:hypothetical protein